MGKQHQKQLSIEHPRKSHPKVVEETRNPEPHTPLTFSPTNILRLQRTIGNKAVHRLLTSQITPARMIQRTPDTAVAPETERPTESDPVEIEIEEGMYIGGEEFHAKALPKNQYYAARPPSPGWPYTDRLKALWEAGQYNDFADEVAAFQHFTLKLPEDQVDGILGPGTSKRLRETVVTETQSEGETPQDADAVVATPTADDPAVTNHPAAVRILTPVKQAFNAYKTAENAYKNATTALDRAKKGDKTAKEEARKETMVAMEEKREEARAAMAVARGQVAALNVSEFAGETELARVKAYINQQLNNHTIFYAQGHNANILWRPGMAAAGRTCNMTVIAMILEALGKSSKDYNGDLSQIEAIAKDYSDQLKVNNSDPEDVTSLRLPDFLQLAAIDITGSREVAAASITKHNFITEIARRFGLKLTEIKGGETKLRSEEADSFLNTKFTSKLGPVGTLYRPAESDAAKEVSKDETYKGLKGKEREAYKQQYIQTYTENKRLEFIANIEAWIKIDTQTQEQLTALQSEVNQMDSTDPKKQRAFDTELQAKTDETITKLKEIKSTVPANYEGKHKELKAMIDSLEKARKQDGKKPTAPPKQLRALFDDKQRSDPLRVIEDNLQKYADLKSLYEKLGKEGGIEEVIPVEEYKASVISTMEAAISAGNQVMLGLENHFVRLQSVSDDGFVIDDPGSRTGEDNLITWEHGRKYGYFKHYLLLSS